MEALLCAELPRRGRRVLFQPASVAHATFGPHPHDAEDVAAGVEDLADDWVGVVVQTVGVSGCSKPQSSSSST